METLTMVTPRQMADLRAEVQVAHDLDMVARGFGSLIGTQGYGVHYSEGGKFFRLDIGSSGAWMVRKSDGAIFGIKGYGTPHYGKAHGFIGGVTGVDLVAHRFTSAGKNSLFRKDITK